MPQYQKGVAAKLPFVQRDSTGALMTGRTIIAHISKDGSAMVAPSSGTAPAVELEAGGYYYNLSAADMNADQLAVRLFALGTPACMDTFEFISTENDLTTAVVANLTTKVNLLPALFTTVLTEAYAALGATPTLAQLLFEVRSLLAEKVIVGTTLVAKKVDGSTTAGIYSTNDATNPTSITRAS